MIPIHSHTHTPNERYFSPHQARQRPATAYEDQLGDALERAFAAGHWELDALVAQLNRTGPLASNSAPWTAESFQAEMAQRGQ
jgi:hypothetical protein